MIKYLKQLPVQLLISIITAFALGYLWNVSSVSFFYSISSCFIEAVIFLLPLMVFSFIFRALVNSQRNSLSLLLLIFAGVTCSNCLALTIAYFFGRVFLPFLGLNHSPDFMFQVNSQIDLLFSLNLPTLIGTEKALILGLISGIGMSFFKEGHPFKKAAQTISSHFNQSIILFLQKIFMPLLPLYVFGFCLKLSYDHALVHLFQQFGKVFLLSIGLAFLYIYLLYLFGSGWDIKKARSNLIAMLPAGLTGFSTMSSAVTMPVTLACTEKMTQDRQFTDLIIPATTNIHMLGDDLTITITALTLLSIFDLSWPDYTIFIPFVLAFSLAKLSCVGVPGASVLVVLPVLQNHLGFNSEMVSILTTIYILQDPFGTAANVMGNGAFALIIHRIFFRKKAVYFTAH